MTFTVVTRFIKRDMKTQFWSKTLDSERLALIAKTIKSTHTNKKCENCDTGAYARQ